jgi:hypothetical protein
MKSYELESSSVPSNPFHDFFFLKAEAIGSFYEEVCVESHIPEVAYTRIN